MHRKNQDPKTYVKIFITSADSRKGSKPKRPTGAGKEDYEKRGTEFTKGEGWIFDYMWPASFLKTREPVNSI